MAKIRKYKLSWKPSESQNITGYKIYWSESGSVNYDSKYINVGNVTEVKLSNEIISSGGTIMFGVAAIDRDGNESDIITMDKPYKFHIPKAPGGLLLGPLEDFRIIDTIEKQSDTSQNIESNESEDDPFVEAIESNGGSKKVKTKYYDDIGYR